MDEIETLVVLKYGMPYDKRQRYSHEDLYQYLRTIPVHAALLITRRVNALSIGQRSYEIINPIIKEELIDFEKSIL